MEDFCVFWKFVGDNNKNILQFERSAYDSFLDCENVWLSFYRSNIK